MKRKVVLACLGTLSLAGASGGGPAISAAHLLKQRQANVAALGTHPELLQTGGLCWGIPYRGESKGGGVAFPVGRASPVYVDQRGVYFAFDFPGGQPRRLWCMGDGATPLKQTAYQSPIWQSAVQRYGKKGRQGGHFPDVAGPVDLYWNFAGEQYASRLGRSGHSICEGQFTWDAASPFPPPVRWVCGH